MLKFNGDNKLNVAGAQLDSSSSLRSLGVVIDSKLSFNEHVTKVCQACNYHIRALNHIRPMLSDATALTVATSIVMSKLDYCNSLLYETSQKNFNKLQRVQNALARTVTRSSRRTHMRPLLAPLFQIRMRNEMTTRSFGFAVADVWNALPVDLNLAPSLDIFKAKLKTFLFQEACRLSSRFYNECMFGERIYHVNLPNAS